jgi:hypothetical protein
MSPDFVLSGFRISRISPADFSRISPERIEKYVAGGVERLSSTTI